MKKRTIWLLIQFLFVILCVSALAEIYLRLTQQYLVYSEINGGEYYSDYGKIYPDWFHTWHASDTFTLPSPDFHYPYSINKLGFRDKNYDETKPDSVFRILVTGDSYAEGLGAPYDSTWPRLLEKNLRARNLNVEVINAGVAGSDILYDYVFYREKLRSFHPDLVLASFNTSDYNDYLIRGGMERFYPDTTTHFVSPPWYEKYYKHSRFLRALFHKIGGFNINGLFISYKQFDASSGKASTVFADVLNSYSKEVEKDHAKFIAVLITTAGDLMPSKNPISKTNNQITGTLDSLLKMKNITTLNLYKPLIAEFAQKPPLVYTYRHDLHFNPTGYAFVAQQITDSICTLGILSGCTKSTIP